MNFSSVDVEGESNIEEENGNIWVLVHVDYLNSKPLVTVLKSANKTNEEVDRCIAQTYLLRLEIIAFLQGSALGKSMYKPPIWCATHFERQIHVRNLFSLRPTMYRQMG